MKYLDEYFDKFGLNISGLTDDLKGLYIDYLFRKNDGNIIVLTSSLFEATKYYEMLGAYIGNVLLFPMDDFLTSVALAISPDLKIKRLETLQKIKENKRSIVVTNLMGFLRFVPNLDTINKLEITLNSGSNINRDSLEKIINEFGYSKTSIVTSSGEYSIRGFVIDIFPYNFDNPIRIELFGNSIEKIRLFDPETQLTNSSLDAVDILPYTEIVNSNKSNIYDVLNNPLVIKIDKDLIDRANEELENQIFLYKEEKSIPQNEEYMFHYDRIFIKNEADLGTFDIAKSVNITCEGIPDFNSNIELINNYISNNISKFNIILCSKNEKLISYFKESFDINTNPDKIMKNVINVVNLVLNHGFIIGSYLVLSDKDINSNLSNKQKYTNPVKIGRKIKNFNDIKNGDYVVHAVHGIGVYGGVITLTKNGVQKDYIMINYAGNDKVYIPVEKISTIYKYCDGEGKPPKINVLNSTSWSKTKASVKARIKDISKDLLKLYSERATLKSPKFSFTAEDTMFANQFEYNETRDQVKCINDVLLDLKTDVPMDRLLCGDVGFGKTEVAFRAIFNAIINGYQVAYLCPTTILSKQQFNNALERFKNFPINIRIVNRFTSQRDFTKILDELKNGSVDLIFGTHKLFNNQIEYKNLGLLVVDEEQRFGVAQKERIKEITKNVNVLTLSATPIPRTLKMAMSGLKDLSILDTAPDNRYPVQTYVVEKNDLLIKEAIYKELSRNGQVFYLYNNVSKISSEADKLRKLVPDAKICIAHGQMSKQELEDVIEDFVQYKYDILVCTTIIETGIDIANVNTLIVVEAQNYGLSQLYQLRGRVGRSNKIAYAYLTYNPNKMLNEIAIKRLQAIKEFTELGSGYKIAMRDLSIRGAGDLLGSDQAGFIDSVGIDLYTKMLEESINELKGIETKEDSMEQSLINVDTHVDESYVSDESVRIEIHQLINEIEDYSSLKRIKNEIEDRFGKVDEKLIIYMYEEWFEKLASKLNIKNVIQSEDKIEFSLTPEISSKINGEKLFLQLYNISTKFKLRYQLKRITFTLPVKNLEKHYLYYLVDLLLLIIEEVE